MHKGQSKGSNLYFAVQDTLYLIYILWSWHGVASCLGILSSDRYRRGCMQHSSASLWIWNRGGGMELTRSCNHTSVCIYVCPPLRHQKLRPVLHGFFIPFLMFYLLARWLIKSRRIDKRIIFVCLFLWFCSCIKQST